MPKKDENLLFERKFAHDSWDQKTKNSCFLFAKDYKEFLTSCKTERLCVKYAQKIAENNGFKELEHIGQIKQKGFNAPVYSVNRGKAIILAKPGKCPLTAGLRLILAHIDSPRLDLKMKPLYENEHLAYLKTHYYGGIKKYQWTALPLAIYGTIVKTNGSSAEIAVGDKPDDPVFMISDLLAHLSEQQLEKKLKDAIAAETLNVLVGNTTADTASQEKEKEKDLVKKNILQLLNKQYGIKEEDFISADLELVPAGAARDLGFDGSLIAAYGHDDRSCAYDALRAVIDAKTSEFASVVVLVDKEETGSEGATGANSNFILDFISELIYLETGVHDENILRDVFFRSKAISADVTAAYDPDYPDVFDANNTARLGAGAVIEKHTGWGGKFGTSEATPEFTAKIMKTFNDADVVWQPGGFGKVDIGGGGTIAMFLARFNLDIIDVGVSLLSMHAPFEIASKSDVYSTYLAYKAFFESQ